MDLIRPCQYRGQGSSKLSSLKKNETFLGEIILFIEAKKIYKENLNKEKIEYF